MDIVYRSVSKATLPSQRQSCVLLICNQAWFLKGKHPVVMKLYRDK